MADNANANCRSNTVDENAKILRELSIKIRSDNRSEEELKKLFTQLNKRSCMKVEHKVEPSPRSLEQDRLIPDKVYGPISGFPPGSWWGIRLDCSRDRVHLPLLEKSQAGDLGVTSICIPSANEHNDVDFGDALTFTGVRYLAEDPNGDPLLQNYKHRIPVRVIRSYSLSNDFAPKAGYRYDGLYSVLAHWICQSTLQKYHKFLLRRLTNQEPPPWYSSDFRNSSKTVRNGLTLSRRSSRMRAHRLHEVEEKLKSSTSTSCLPPEHPRLTSNTCSIVSRQVFLKPHDRFLEGNSQSSTNHDSEVASSPNQNEASSFTSKLRNTNISIRTDLYDSTHNDRGGKKASIISRISKVDISNKNSEFPMVEEKLDEDEKEADAGDATLRSERVTRQQNGNRKRRRRNHDSDDSVEGNIDDSSPQTNICVPNSLQDSFPLTRSMVSEKILYNKEETMKNSSEAAKVRFSTDSNANENVVTDVRDSEPSLTRLTCEEMDRREMENTKVESASLGIVDGSSTPQATSQKGGAIGNGLDSLTPEKVVQLVTEKRRHPMSRVLINGIIGYTIEEDSSIMRAYDILSSHKTPRNAKPRSEGKPEKENGTLAGISRSCFRFKKRRKCCSSSECNAGEVETVRTRSTGRVKNQEQQSEVSERASARKKASMVKRKETKLDKLGRIRRSLRRTRKMVEVGIEERKTRKRRTSKEIANLFIDAKMGIEIRESRYQRHRRINGILRKKRRRDLESITCPRRPSSIEKMKKLPLKRTEEKRRRRMRSYNRKAKTVKETRNEIGLERKTSSLRLRKPRNSQENSQTIEVSKSHFDRSVLRREIAKRRRNREPEGEEQTAKKYAEAAVQCNLIRQMSSPMGIPLGIDEREQDMTVKMEIIDLEEIKSEMDETESLFCDNHREEPETPDPRRSQRLEENESGRLSMSDESESDYPQLRSAFVPVVSSECNFRIAKLRAIGFRPIEPHVPGQRGGSSKTFTTKVVPRDVNAEYEKYTNDENQEVGYMDEALRYEDIENEDVNRAQYAAVAHSSEDEDTEPWHGWKEIVSNGIVDWIGW